MTHSPASAPANTPTITQIVWRFTDGRAGHDNQSRGLLLALERIAPLEVHDVGVPTRAKRVLNWISGRSSMTQQLPAPDLIVGAGHDTHLPMLTARRQHGGRIVVLMLPTLPNRWFDLCIVPEHDDMVGNERVLVTRGVVNAVQPQTEPDPRSGLILIGGPSQHFQWNEERLVDQIRELVSQGEDRDWTIATSRRTPTSSCHRFEGLTGQKVSLVNYQTVDANWLPSQLATAGVIWVTEDSVSMIYEALTAGGATGIIDLARRRQGRVQRGLDELVAGGMVTRFRDWQVNKRPLQAHSPLREAERCALWIKDHWLSAA